MRKKKIDYDKLAECPQILKYAYLRRRDGLYSLILVTGLPGTGKSFLSLRLVELIQKEFGMEVKISPDDIVSDFPGFTRRVRKVKKIEVGNPDREEIIIEEVSVLFPSKRAMSKDNVDLGKILDTARELEVVLIANAPIYPSIDSHMRSMSNILIQTVKVVRSSGVCVFKAWKLRTDPHTGKTYRYRFKDSRGREIDYHIIRLPSKEILSSYGKKKIEFREELYDRIEREAIERKNKVIKQKPVILNEESLTPLQKNVYDLFFKQGLNQKETAIKLNIKEPSQISRIVKSLRLKGGILLGN